MSDDTEATVRATAPYVGFPSYVNLVAGLKEHALPGRIDRSVLGKFSGIVGGQLLAALRFFDLIDKDGHPKPRLRELVDAYGTDKWPDVLGGHLKNAYAPLLALKLDTASPAQFNEVFRRHYSAEGDTYRKCVSFFLNAANDAKIAISPYILKNKKARVAAVKKRPQKPNVGGDDTHPDPPTPSHKEHAKGAKTPYEVLMNDIYDPRVMEAASEEEKAVFTLARFLKSKEASK